MMTEKDFKLLLKINRQLMDEVKELKELIKGSPKLNKPEKFLTSDQAAKQLGIGKTKMSEMLRSGELPFATKVGRKWRLSQSELERYIART